MDSNTFQLTCPICGRTDIGSIQSHLQTHSKQSLIDILINQQQVHSPEETKRSTDPEFICADLHRNAEDADPSIITPSGSSRRNGGIALRHSHSHSHGHGQPRSPRSSHSRRTSSTNNHTGQENPEILISASSASNQLEVEQPLASSSAGCATSNSGQSYLNASEHQEPHIYELEIRTIAGQEDRHITVSENSIPVCSFQLSKSSDAFAHSSCSLPATQEESEDQEEVDNDCVQFEEEQVMALVAEEEGNPSKRPQPIYVSESGHDMRELETAATLALKMAQIPRSNGITHSNFIKYIIDENGTRAVVDAEPNGKWMFGNGVVVPVYSSIQEIPSSSSQSQSQNANSVPAGMRPAVLRSAVEEDSSLSNSKTANSRIRTLHGTDVDLMTDEEIPPRGEISEYEESNTSSVVSEDSKHGLVNSSLGSMFSDRARRHLSPVIMDLESASSHSKKKKRAKSLRSTEISVTSSFTVPEGHRCTECTHEQYFNSIFELAQHHTEVHQKTFNSGIKKMEGTQSELDNEVASLDWIESYRNRASSTGPLERDTLNLKDEGKRVYKRKEFSCLYCVFSALDKKSLAAHVESEHTGKLLDPSQFECTTCGKMFFARTNLVKHLLIHRGKRHVCGTCKKAFTSQFKLKEHFRVHTRDYPFACAHAGCDRSFRTPSLRSAHIRRVHEGIKIEKTKVEFYCGICHRVLHSKAGLLSHTQTHYEIASKCKFCQETFPKKSILVRHIRIAHDSTYESKESKECPVCLKMFHPNSMKSHLRIHKGEKPFPCQVCSMTFRTYANLTSHSWSHTNVDKPFKCKKCPKSYLFKKYLDSHMIVHKRRTSHFTCNECGVKFTSKMNMKRHIEEHFKDKKYKCKTCGKCFHRKYYLSEHERIHSNIKPFSCNICGKTSTTKSNHRSHVKIHDARESGTLEG